MKAHVYLLRIIFFKNRHYLLTLYTFFQGTNTLVGTSGFSLPLGLPRPTLLHFIGSRHDHVTYYSQ